MEDTLGEGNTLFSESKMELQYEEVFNAAEEQRPQNQMEKNQIYRKRKRTSYSSAQIEEFERVFNMNNYLSLADRVRLAKEMDLPEYQVKIWFQNHRMKLKKQNRDHSDSTSIVKKARRTHNLLDPVESVNSYESLHVQPPMFAQQHPYPLQQQPFFILYEQGHQSWMPPKPIDGHNFTLDANYTSSIEGSRVNCTNYGCQDNVLQQEQQIQVQQQNPQPQQQLLPQPEPQRNEQLQLTLQHLQQEKQSLLEKFSNSFTCPVYDEPLEDFIIELPSGEICNQDDFYKEMCKFFNIMDSPNA